MAKTYFFILIIFLFSASAKAQKIEELLNRFVELKKKKEYEKALLTGDSLIYQYKQKYGDTTVSYSHIISFQADCYVKVKQYEKAELLYIESISNLKKVKGEQNEDYLKTLNALALLYRTTNQYNKAELTLMQLLNSRKKASGDHTSQYAILLQYLGDLYKQQKDFKKAEPFYIQATGIWENISGETDYNYVTCLNNFASLYYEQNEFIKVEPLYLKIIEVEKKISGDSTVKYATRLNNLAALYLQLGEYEKAEPLFIQAKEIRKKILGENHTDYTQSLNYLAELYRNMGEYEKAEPLYILVKETYKKKLGEAHPNYAAILNNLGALYKDMGEYEKAEPLFIQTKEIFKKSLGETHPGYATSLNNLALLYQEMGQYEKAETLYIQATAIDKKALGEVHPGYATSINNLAVLYQDMGQYEKAEPLYIQAKKVYQKVLGEDHPDYAMSLNNLGALYKDMGEYEKAEPLYIQAKKVYQNKLGEDHPTYATSLNNLAVLYKKMGEYKKAEPLYVQAKKIYQTKLGEDHPGYATSLNNLALLYKDMGEYEKAEPLFIQAKVIFKKMLGETSAYSTSLNNLSLLYQNMNQHKKAEPLLNEANKIEIKNLLTVFSIQSEKEKGNYLTNNITLNNSNNSFLYNYRNASPGFYKDNYNLQLLLKSLSLSDTKNAMEAVRSSKDTVINKLFTNWQNDKKILSKQYSLPIANRRADLQELEASIENLEKELNRKSAGFRKQQNALRISMADVQKYLGEDEVAIEFVRFDLYNKEWTDSTMYAAYILRKNDSIPIFVPLCEEKQLGKYFSSTIGAATIKAIYRSDAIDEDNKPAISGDSLYALICKPLLPYLKGIKKINYSPAGLLYKVAFHALPAGDSQLLLDKYELNQYTSTRQLALTEEKKNSTTSITLFGDCQFTMDSISIITNMAVSEKANTLITASANRGETVGSWKQLSGTAEEIKNIQTLFKQNKINTTSFSQINATEEQFKSLSGQSPKILHLATHGFFLPDPEKKKKEGFAVAEKNSFTLADDPLLRSGIVLSGANRVWSGGSPISGREDGIVTAYEIAQMDLSKTDLVVLSACETALGDIKGNEGVFGLQRAFKMAGVKNMLLSLWKVPDAETAELMQIFYTNYLQGKTAREALASAQQEMRKKYRPYYWAAFVLIE